MNIKPIDIEIKPCVCCGKYNIFRRVLDFGLFNVYGISCQNLNCKYHNVMVNGIGFTEKQAEKRAISKWDKRFNKL